MDIEEAEERMALLCYFLGEMGETFKFYYLLIPTFTLALRKKKRYKYECTSKTKCLEF